MRLLKELNRDLFSPALVMMRPDGEFRDAVPADVPIFDLDAGSLWRVIPPLASVLRRERPEIVFSMGAMSVPTALALKLARTRPRFVISERNMLDHTRLTAKRRLLTLLKRRLYSGADGLIAVSEGVKNDLVRKLRLPPERVSVLFNPIVADDLAERAAAPLEHPWFDGSVPVVLAVGRLVPQKDYPTLLRAFAEARKRYASKLVILGEGPLRPELEKQVAALKLEGDVSLPGFDPNPFRYMARAQVYTLSSLHEGLPGSLIQAMANGAAVVATDCPSGPAEIIEDGVDGKLVPVGDVDALASSIMQFLKDAEIRHRLGARARRSAQRFRVEPVVRRYEQVLLGHDSPDLVIENPGIESR